MDRGPSPEASQAARESELDLLRQQFDALIRALPLGIWITDDAGRVVATNCLSHENTVSDGAGSPAANPKLDHRVWLPEARRKLPVGEYPIRRVLETGLRVPETEVRIRRDDGTEGVVLAAATPIFDAAGNLRGAIGVSQDATERWEVEARYREVFKAFHHCEVITDSQGKAVDYRILDVNPAWARMTGIDPADAVGRTARELVTSPEPEWIEACGRAGLLRESVRLEQEISELGMWYDVHLVPFGAPESRQFLATAADITARKRAEAEREQMATEIELEQARLRAVVLHTPAPLALLEGPEHRFTLVNDAYKRISGGGRDVTGLTPPEAFPELAGSGIYELFDQVYETGLPWYGPETLARYDRDGTGVIDTWFDLRLEPVRDAHGRVTAIFNFAVDVTEQVLARREVERLLVLEQQARAEAEAARRDTERAARITQTVTTHIAEGICLMDSEGRLTYMNPAAERILRWRESELLGEVLHDRVHYCHPDGRPFPIEECPLGKVLTAAHPVVGLADQWIRKDGSFVHVITTCTPIVEDGQVTGAVLSLHDDTDRRNVEAEREGLLEAAQVARTEAESARQEAEAANRGKSEFLAVMSHELRTPLNAIGGYAELIEMGIRGPVTPEQQGELNRIQGSQRHLLGLINEVLNYAKLETGMVHYEIAPVGLRDAIADAVMLVAPQAQTRKLELLVADVPPELRVSADKEKLRQILVNLLSNAVKFTDIGGRVDVAYAEDGESVQITVRDTGIGIPDDQLDRIFEPFVQVRADLTRTAEGTGLGLAISRDLARGMGGDLAAQSRLGEGSVFRLTLPVAVDV
jgi:PAS domain S-box-containing protein